VNSFGKKRYKKRNKKKGNRRFVIWITILTIIAFLLTSYYRNIARFAVYSYVRFGIVNLFSSPLQKEFIKNFGIRLPLKYKIHGLDVSNHQRVINWNLLSQMKVDSVHIVFAFIKATEGKNHFDMMFDYNWENAKKYHIIRGAYHYYDPNINSTRQAKNFISTVSLENGDLPPVLDIEETGTLGTSNMLKGIMNWLIIVEKHYGIKPIIYTYIKFYDDYLSDNEDFNSYPVWIAHYYRPKLPADFKWSFWQHNNKGHVNGIKGYVDFNVFNGNVEDLMRLCKK
jgi:lysozyme